jgi:hypothetical protein
MRDDIHYHSVHDDGGATIYYLCRDLHLTNDLTFKVREHQYTYGDVGFGPIGGRGPEGHTPPDREWIRCDPKRARHPSGRGSPPPGSDDRSPSA